MDFSVRVDGKMLPGGYDNLNAAEACAEDEVLLGTAEHTEVLSETGEIISEFWP